MSGSKKVRVPWNKGKTGVYSKDVLFKMGSRWRGKKNPKHSEEMKGKNHPKPWKGKHRSKGTKELIGQKIVEYFKDPEHREKISGSNCNWYIDGRSSGYDLPQMRPEHIRWAKQIRKRDNYTCQLCGKRGNFVHHIDYNKDNFNLGNGVCLCNSCHTKTNTKREYWMSLFHSVIITRISDHPGLEVNVR